MAAVKVTKNIVYYNGKNYSVNEVIEGIDDKTAKEFIGLGVVEKYVAPKEEVKDENKAGE